MHNATGVCVCVCERSSGKQRIKTNSSFSLVRNMLPLKCFAQRSWVMNINATAQFTLCSARYWCHPFQCFINLCRVFGWISRWTSQLVGTCSESRSRGVFRCGSCSFCGSRPSRACCSTCGRLQMCSSPRVRWLILLPPPHRAPVSHSLISSRLTSQPYFSCRSPDCLLFVLWIPVFSNPPTVL